MTYKLDYFFIIKVYLSDGEIWETRRHTLEGMSNFCKDIFSDEKVVRYSVEERMI